MRRRRALRFPAVLALGLALAACSPVPSAPPELLPGFGTEAATLDTVVIEQAGQRLVFRRHGAQWRIEGADWRVDRRWLQPLLMNLAVARCDAPRTADPARYARIGVAWPPPAEAPETGAFAQPTGRLTLVTGGATRHLVVGFPRGRGGTYVRVEGTAPSCLTAVDLRLPENPGGWFDPRLWAEPIEPPSRVRVEEPGGVLVLVRDGERYRPEGRAAPASPLPDALVAALTGLRQDGLRAIMGDAPPADRVLRFASVAGEAYAVGLRREEGQTWLQVIEAPAREGGGFAGRVFRLPADVADPLWADRAALGGG